MRASLAILWVGLVLAVASPGAQSAGASPFTDADAERFSQKIADIVRNGTDAAPSRQPIDTTVTEFEVNAYLHFRANAQLPAGIAQPRVSALGDGRLDASAVVDLDAIRLARPRRWFDPMRLLRGSLPVRARGVLRTAAGEARFAFESASVDGLSIPQVVLQELVTFYTRGPAFPDGIDLDAPFALPVGIREIAVLPGRATVTQ